MSETNLTGRTAFSLLNIDGARKPTSATYSEDSEESEFTFGIPRRGQSDRNAMPSMLVRKLEAKVVDISPSAVGPNTARQAQLALVASRRSAFLWLEEQAAIASSTIAVPEAPVPLVPKTMKRDVSQLVVEGSGDMLATTPARRGSFPDTFFIGYPGLSVLSQLASLAMNPMLPLPGPEKPPIPPTTNIKPIPTPRPAPPPFCARKRESVASACRRRIQDWSKYETLAPVTDIKKYEWMSAGQEKSAKQKASEEEAALLNTAPYFADRNAHLSSSCIGLADIDSKQFIKWEKKRIMDLREKERIIPKIFALQKETNDLVLTIKRASAQRMALLNEVELKRRTREAVDSVLTEFFNLHKKFTEKLSEVDKLNDTLGIASLNPKTGRHKKHGKHAGGYLMPVLDVPGSRQHSISMSGHDDSLNSLAQASNAHLEESINRRQSVSRNSIL